MADRSKFELKVGIFVFLGLAALCYIVFSIGDFYILRPGYHIKLIFGYASGVEVGAPVRFAGVEVGKVEDIMIFYDQKEEKTRVEVTAWVQSSTQIERDAQAYVNTLGLLGEKYIEILPGTRQKGFLQEGNTIVGTDPIPTEKLTERAYQIAGDLQKTLDSVNEIMDKIRKGEGTIGKLITEDKIHRDLEALVADLKKHPWKLLKKDKESKESKRDEPKKSKERGFSIGP